MSRRITTEPGQLSYPKLLKPALNELNKKLEYSSVLIFPEGTDLTELKKLAFEAAVEKWGADKAKWPANRRSPFRRGEEKPDSDGYGAGKVFITAKQDPDRGRPTVVDHEMQDVIDPSEVYPGRWARFSVRAYAYSAGGNNGVSFGLVNVQLLDHDTAFGGSGPVNPDDDFEPVPIVQKSGADPLADDDF